MISNFRFWNETRVKLMIESKLTKSTFVTTSIYIVYFYSKDVVWNLNHHLDSLQLGGFKDVWALKILR